MLQRRHFQKSQYGQGMVEYAILLILTVTLVIGGIELASAALASGKASDAAKAGASDLASINEIRLKAQGNQEKYLRQIDMILNGATFAVDENGAFSESNDPLTTTSALPAEFENYVKFLDSFRGEFILDLTDGASVTYEDIIREYLEIFDVDTPDLYFFDDYNKDIATNPDDDANVDGATGDLEEIIASIDGIIDTDNDGDVDGDDADGEISVEELIYAVQQGKIKQEILNLAPTDADDTGDPTVADDNDKVVRYKALLLFEELELALLPLDPRVALSESTPLIGDHIPDYVANMSAFQRPACTVDLGTGELEYTTGFPGTDDADGVAKTAVEVEDGITIDAPAVYLFNPLPVDAVSCQGNDAARGGRSRMSILMGGHGKEGEENYFPGLPKLNQAFYGQYTRVCLNNANEYVACGSANVAQELLKPPGKFCLSDVATTGVDSCPGIEEDHIETSGYYFWGFPSGQDKFKWIYDRPDAPEFRPTMQLTCNNQGEDSDGDDVSQYVSSESCDPTLSEEPVKTVRINVRYRSVFESFLTFGLMELTNPNGIANLADYFYDPSNLRALGNGAIGVPIAGSELGPKSANKNPTVKNFKDFRGCFDINLETNQVTSCN